MKSIFHYLCAAAILLASLAACTSTTPVQLPATSTVTATATPTLAPDANARLTRGPYLQTVTTDSIVIVWDTDLPSAGQVAYGPTQAYGSTQPAGTVGVHHEVALTGLSAYTTYYYQVQNGETSLGEGASFRTAAGPDQTSFTFVVYGDTRTRNAEHQSVVDRIVQLQPDFAIQTGDLVESGWTVEQWDTFFQIEGRLMASVPVFPTFGNHEMTSQYYLGDFVLPNNEKWYSFDYGNARFVCLKIDGEEAYGPRSEQYAWLESTLAANTQPWLFVYFHIPPFAVHGSDESSLEDLQTILVPFFEQYHVNAVFAGHVHNYQRSVVNGINYIVAGGGGAPAAAIGTGDENRVYAESTLHAVYITINGKTLTSVGVRPDGTEFDRFTLSLP